MYERFTDRARKVMQLANQEAQRFNHEYVGTEHVLLGLIKEGSEALEEDMDEDVKDAALIAAAQRVEHYEIAGYGTARTFGNLLDQDEAASLLVQTLEEEKETDAKLTELAEDINVAAEEGSEEETAGEKKSRSTTRRKSAA